MTREIKFLLPDLDNGKWNWTKEAESYNTAIPKVLNSLQSRIDKVLSNIWKSFRKALYQEKNIKKIANKIQTAEQEFDVHLFMLTDFQRRISEILEDQQEGSPLMSLKKMDSPISRRKHSTFNYERIESSEILKKIEDEHQIVENLVASLPKILSTWNKFIEIRETSDPHLLFTEMKSLRMVLETLPSEYREALFSQDDVVKGVLKRGIRLRVNLHDLQKKLEDTLFRTLLAACLDYKHSDEKGTIENIIFRLRELDLTPSEHLLKIKTLLETEAKSVPSTLICYKKIGELHQNLHQKLFLADSLNYLRKYWSQELLTAVDLFSDSLLELHKELSFTDPEGQEIEIYIGVLQDLLMNAQPGNEYFSLNNKMHNKHLVLASRYNTVSQEHLESGLKALSGTLFTKLVINCEHLMRKLRHERTPAGVETTDIEKIGRAVGKTTMIDTYEKSVDEILANLGTFISNTLHVLIGEILNNLPADSKWRESLVNNYELSEEAMNTL